MKKDKNVVCIYKITNCLNGKIYIGETKNYKRRMKEYKYKSIRLNKHSKYGIMIDINKHGIGNFTFEILEEVENVNDLDDRERYWIKTLRSRNPDIGYNSKTGGRSYGEMTDETRKLMSGSSKGFKHTEAEKLRRSTPIISVDPDCLNIQWHSSAKSFADIIGTDRTVITRSIRKGQMIFGYFVFYADEPLRYETYQHVLEKRGRGKISTNLKKYVNTYLILQEMCRD